MKARGKAGKILRNRRRKKISSNKPMFPIGIPVTQADMLEMISKELSEKYSDFNVFVFSTGDDGNICFKSFFDIEMNETTFNEIHKIVIDTIGNNDNRNSN